MPSIRDFLTLVETRDSGHRITLRTPLTADANKPEIGWVTRITFTSELLEGRGGRPLATVQRITTLVTSTPHGLRRRLKGQPHTTERLMIRATGGTYITSTVWGERETSATSTPPELSFAIADLVPLLRGVIETNEGRPLLDWLAENNGGVSSPFRRDGNRTKWVADDVSQEGGLSHFFNPPVGNGLEDDPIRSGTEGCPAPRVR